VHANYGAPISFFSSPPPIILPYLLELDSIVYNTIHRCLIDNIEVRCSSIKSTWPFPDFLYETCIFEVLEHCLYDINMYKNPIMFSIMKMCIKINCHSKLKTGAIHRRSARYVSCLLECYERNIKNPYKSTYTQNP
jgi:hypothetical protein